MPSSRRDLERTPRRSLGVNLRQVRTALEHRVGQHRRGIHPHRRQRQAAVQMPEEQRERGRPHHLQAPPRRQPPPRSPRGPRGPGVRPGGRRLGDGRHSTHGPNPPIQPQLPHEGPTVEAFRVNVPCHCEQPHRDREIERASFLAHVRRGRPDTPKEPTAGRGEIERVSVRPTLSKVAPASHGSSRARRPGPSSRAA